MHRLPRCAPTASPRPTNSTSPAPYTRISGYQRIRAALRAGLDFTAVFASTDMVAAGALTALREAHLDVPGDISLVGFDDVPFAADLTPALTTVRVPFQDFGRTAVRLALHGEDRPAADDHVVLSTQLVIRQSVRTLDRPCGCATFDGSYFEVTWGVVSRRQARSMSVTFDVTPGCQCRVGNCPA